MESAVGETDLVGVTSFHGSHEIRVVPLVGSGGRLRTHTSAWTVYPPPSVTLGESTVTAKCWKVAVCFIAKRPPLGVSGVERGGAVTVVVTVTGAGADTVAVTLGVELVEGEAVAWVVIPSAGREGDGSS